MKKEPKKLKYVDLRDLQSVESNEKIARRIAENVLTKEYFEQKVIPFGKKNNGKNKGYWLGKLFEDNELLSRKDGNVKMNQKNLAIMFDTTQPTISKLFKDLGVNLEQKEEQYTIDEKVELVAKRVTLYQLIILNALAQGYQNRLQSEEAGVRDVDAYANLSEEDRAEWRAKKAREKEEAQKGKRKYRRRRRKAEIEADFEKKKVKKQSVLDKLLDNALNGEMPEQEEPKPQPKPQKSQLSKKSENQTKNDKKGGLNDKEILGLVSSAINNLAQLVRAKKVTESDAYAYADLFEDMYRMIKESARFNEWESGEALSKNFFAFSNSVRKTQKVPLPVISKRVTRVVKSSETTPRQLLKQRLKKRG
ncbi:hypothetical protein L1O48_09730 [Ligilactobacillus equi]|uniref:hypothetical protein n=1 Tax=Ligilactobacillus equi TaxID=137357 RepID=UPI002ED1C98F